MSWSNDSHDDVQTVHSSSRIKSCPSCGHQIKLQQQAKINDLPGLPAGVRFDPTDQELVQHLEGKVSPEESHGLHPLIDEFIPTLEGENGICYTHPQRLPVGRAAAGWAGLEAERAVGEGARARTVGQRDAGWTGPGWGFGGPGPARLGKND
ncbi:hypothetical protein KSS87_007093 [Heliosperma pusillum]|nr:hypothetical protein KSS87_007093 [Heliosperma pusillum]